MSLFTFAKMRGKIGKKLISSKKVKENFDMKNLQKYFCFDFLVKTKHFRKRLSLKRLITLTLVSIYVVFFCGFLTKGFLLIVIELSRLDYSTMSAKV